MDPTRVPRPSSVRPHTPTYGYKRLAPEGHPIGDQSLLLKPLEGCGSLGDQVALSQSLDALDHPTHDRS
jgi:hypothetical protein